MSSKNVTASQTRFFHALNSHMAQEKMTQTELAAKTKIQRTVINEILNLKRNPGIKTQERIAAAFGLELLDFLKYEHKRETLINRIHSSNASTSPPNDHLLMFDNTFDVSDYAAKAKAILEGPKGIVLKVIIDALSKE
jgi:Helix-turn-helix.